MSATVGRDNNQELPMPWQKHNKAKTNRQTRTKIAVPNKTTGS